MLSYPGRHCYTYVKVSSSCGIALKRIQGLLEAYFKINKNSGEQEKESSRIEKIRPSGSPLVFTRKASLCQTAILGRIFISYPHMIDSYNLGKFCNTFDLHFSKQNVGLLF